MNNRNSPTETPLAQIYRTQQGIPLRAHTYTIAIPSPLLKLSGFYKQPKQLPSFTHYGLRSLFALQHQSLKPQRKMLSTGLNLSDKIFSYFSFYATRMGPPHNLRITRSLNQL